MPPPSSGTESFHVTSFVGFKTSEEVEVCPHRLTPLVELLPGFTRFVTMIGFPFGEYPQNSFSVVHANNTVQSYQQLFALFVKKVATCL